MVDLHMKFLFALFLIFFYLNNTFAHVPIEECFFLYKNTKDKYKDISPIWAKIILQSGQLKGIRLFGDFSSHEHPDLKPHPAFKDDNGTLEYNAPQDAISALLQYLFPSPNGQVLAINERDNDPIGYLGKNKELSILSAIIKEFLDLKAKKISTEEFGKKLINHLNKTRQKNDKNGSRKKRFNSIRDHFVSIFIKALDAEAQGLFKEKYPDNIILHALFAFTLTTASTIDEIYENFAWLFVDSCQKQIFTKENYETSVTHLLNDPNFQQPMDNESLISALLGFSVFEQKIPAPLPYTKASYIYQGQTITYPNCGETTLLNVLYYFWGNNGIISPAYIEATEKKLKDKNNENWQKLKAYFLEFLTIHSSASRIAQEKWSNLLSNLNQDDTDPTLKIVYRQQVCNVKGIGIFNMLNVLEKLLPDATFSEAFSDQEDEKLKEAATKLNKFCYLFSRPEFKVDWRCRGSQKIDSKITDIVFSANEENWFKWQFKENSFGLERITTNKNDWRKKCDWRKTPALIKAWMRSDVPHLRHSIDHPSEIYALDLLSPLIAGTALEKIVIHDWQHLKSLAPQIIGKTLFLNDVFARTILFSILNSELPELNWKTYIHDPEIIQELERMPKEKKLEFLTKYNFWDIAKQFSVQDHAQNTTHLIAASYGYLPHIQWVLEEVPESKNALSPAGNDIVEIAIQLGHHDVIGYLDPPLDYKSKKQQTLLHLYTKSPHDMTYYIHGLLEKRPNLIYSIDRNYKLALENIDQNTNINNIKYVFNKIMNDPDFIKNKANNLDDILIHFVKNASNEALLYLLQNEIPTTFVDLDGNNLLHYLAAKPNKEDALNYLIHTKNFDVNSKNRNKETPLFYAAKENQISNMRFLLENNADPTIQTENDHTPLHALFACNSFFQSNFDIVKLFLSKGADLKKKNQMGESPIELGIKNHIIPDQTLMEIIKLNESVIDLSPNIIIQIDKKKSHKNFLKIIQKKYKNYVHIESESEFTVAAPSLFLHAACHRTNLTLAQYLIEEREHPINNQDLDGNTPLHKAAYFMAPHMIDYLLSKGAKTNLRNNEGDTPLHIISNTNCYYLPRLKILESFITHHIDLNKKNEDGQTALFLAAKQTDHQIERKFIQMLIENGADVNLQDVNGDTALHQFFKFKNNDFSPSFLSNDMNAEHYDENFYQNFFSKFDITLQNNQGETAFLYALDHLPFDNNFSRQIDLLVHLGGDIHTKDKNGRNILHRLVANPMTENQLEKIKYLTEKYDLDVTTKDDQGYQPLHYMPSFFPDMEMAKYLIHKGADASIIFNGESWSKQLSMIHETCPGQKYPF
jgi:ankyrin repeat protein